MSRSLNDEDDRGEGLGLSASALSQMVQSGRSWSGLERNCCYLNTGASPAAGGRFANVSAVSGFDYPDDGRSTVALDWDHDGDLDLWTSNRNAPRLRFLRNESPHNRHYLEIRLAGNGTTTNRDAIGARVEVVTDAASPLRHIATLRAGHGFLTQSGKWLHFGLGEAERLEKVVVRWPGGEAEEFTGLEPDGRYVLAQGSGQAERLQESERSLVLRPERQEVPPQTDQARMQLAAPIPMVSLPYEQFNGRPRSVDTTNGRPKLVILWASWCQPCLHELKEITDRQDEVRAAGVEIVALATNGLGQDTTPLADAKDKAADLHFPFAVGRSDDMLLEVLQLYHNLVTPMRRPLPLPSSFLIDGRGRLVVIYKGPISLDQLLQDVAQFSESGTLAADESDEARFARFESAGALRGRVLADEVAGEALKSAEIEQLYQVADAFRKMNLWPLAANYYLRIIELRPDSERAHTHYAAILILQGNDEQAAEHLKEAIRIHPEAAEPHLVLGNLYMAQRDLAQAQAQYELADRFQPDTPEILNNLGIVNRDQGNLDAALGYFQRALQITPDFAEACFGLATILELRQEWAPAINTYQRAIHLARDQGLTDLVNLSRRRLAETEQNAGLSSP